MCFITPTCVLQSVPSCASCLLHASCTSGLYIAPPRVFVDTHCLGTGRDVDQFPPRISLIYARRGSASSSTVLFGRPLNASRNCPSSAAATLTNVLTMLFSSASSPATRITLTNVSKKSIKFKCMRTSSVLDTMLSAAHCRSPRPRACAAASDRGNSSGKEVWLMARMLSVARRVRRRRRRPCESDVWCLGLVGGLLVVVVVVVVVSGEHRVVMRWSMGRSRRIKRQRRPWPGSMRRLLAAAVAGGKTWKP